MTYLVTREGSKWTDVCRLVPGETIAIGRTPTNHIVIKDERCSRSHAEVFHTEAGWIFRDLDSRNGSFVGGEPIEEDYTLKLGDVIRIGEIKLQFVEDISNVFSDGSSIIKKGGLSEDGFQTKDPDSGDVHVLTESEANQITCSK